MRSLDKQSFFRLIVFIIFITATIPRLRYSLWYDESAVVANAYKYSILEYRHGLDWLQSTSIGYFLLCKTIVYLHLPIFSLRIISLIAALISAEVLLRLLGKQELKISSRITLYSLFLLNPITITYSTMIKPYMLETLITIAAIYSYKRKSNTIFIFIILGPIFGVGASITIFAFLIVNYRKNRKEISSQTTLLIIATTFCYVYSSKDTALVMKSIWFNQDSSLVNNFKSAIGALSWFPTSALGIIPENQMHITFRLSLSILASVFLVLLLTLFRKNMYSKTLIVSFTIFLILASLKIFPIVGRLMLPLAALTYLLIICEMQRFQKRRIIEIFLLSLATIGSLNLISQGANSKLDQLSSNLPTKQILNVYSNNWAGPSAEIFSLKGGLNNHLIYLSENLEMKTCDGSTILEGSYIFLDMIPKELAKSMSTSQVYSIQNKSGSSLILVTARDIYTAEKNYEMIYCKYVKANASTRL